MKKFLLLLVFASLVDFANSQWAQTNGPYGGQNIRCLASSGTNIFAGTSNGVFISSNNGDLWTQVNNGLTNTQIRSIAIKDSNIFVGTWNGVFLSNNNGSSWTLLGVPSNSVVMSIVVKDTFIFAGLYSNFGLDGVYMSYDNGNSWSAVNNGLPFDSIFSAYNIIGLGVSGNNIFAISEKFGMYISSDNGSSWLEANNGLQGSGSAFAASGNNIFSGNSHGVFYSNNNGVLALYISGNDVFAGTCNGVCISNNNGLLWTNISTNGIASLCVNSFVVCGANIFAGTSSSGVWKRSLSELGIEDISNILEIPIFPNPSSDKITIITPDKTTLEISNINGQIIKTIIHDRGETSVDIRDLSSGVYIIKAKTDKGIVTKKFIKQ